MFFGITNSPAIFQTIINKILRDLVNKSKVAIFINNILVETKTKKRQWNCRKSIKKAKEEWSIYIARKVCMKSKKRLNSLELS